MRKAWLTPVAAIASATAMVGTSLVASPVNMAVTGQRSAKPSVRERIASVTAPVTAPVTASDAAQMPSQQISPMRHPFKYFSASVSEMPFPWKKDTTSANPVMPATKEYNDSISLSTPTGQPTPELLITTAQMAEKQGNIDQARTQYQQALHTWPGHVDVLRAAARMEDRLGNLPLAESLYRQASTANPQHAGALNDLGLCLARQGKLDQSVQVIEQAIQLQPEKPLYRNNAATVLVEMRQDQRALAHLAAVHGSADANYNFGQLLVQRGRPADATPYFQAAVEQNPQMENARIALVKLQAGSTTATAAPSPVTQPAPQQPVVAPQYAPQTGPQFTYPATARGPEFGASSYAPPQYYAPSSPYPGPASPAYNGAPRNLPPVATLPTAPVQR